MRIMYSPKTIGATNGMKPTKSKIFQIRLLFITIPPLQKRLQVSFQKYTYPAAYRNCAYANVPYMKAYSHNPLSPIDFKYKNLAQDGLSGIRFYAGSS